MTTEDISITGEQVVAVHAVERALAEAATARTALLRDGRPLYAPDEHERREVVIEQALGKTLTPASPPTRMRRSAPPPPPWNR
jgi:hypothetical protein